MNCSYCGTALPAGAMFCAECGRPVAAKAPASTGVRAQPTTDSTPESTTDSTPAPSAETLVEPVRAAESASEPEPEPSAEPEPEAVPQPIEPAIPEDSESGSLDDFELPVELCAQCGAELESSDIFCGECGFVRRQPTFARGDTAVIAPLKPEPVIEREPEHEPEPEPEAEAEPEPEAEPGLPEPVPHDHAPREPASLIEPSVPGAWSSFAEEYAPDFAQEPDVDEREPDVDETRIVGRFGGGERFVLQFSTGESVSVSGTGLLGRNPIAEPGEYFDTLVTIVDPGKSVSKTHLEFGQDAGAFWISDRHSGNGTIVREPDAQPRRCDAGKRYRIVRGTRVDIGEQFFVVS